MPEKSLLEEAQNYTHVEIGGSLFGRVPRGMEREKREELCAECGAVSGQLHAVNCSIEQCPHPECHDFLADCECNKAMVRLTDDLERDMTGLVVTTIVQSMVDRGWIEVDDRELVFRAYEPELAFAIMSFIYSAGLLELFDVAVCVMPYTGLGEELDREMFVRRLFMNASIFVDDDQAKFEELIARINASECVLWLSVRRGEAEGRHTISIKETAILMSELETDSQK